MSDFLVPEFDIDSKVYEYLFDKCKRQHGDIKREDFNDCLAVAKVLKLNPIKRQIYFLPFKEKRNDNKEKKLIPVTSIDGYRAIAHRTGECTGIKRRPIYYKNKLIAAECTVYRRGHEFTTSVRLNEYMGYSDLWRYKPETMLLKVAESHALRMAFPEQLSAIYTREEMEESIIDVETSQDNQKEISSNSYPEIELPSEILELEKEIKNIAVTNNVNPKEKFPKLYDAILQDRKSALDNPTEEALSNYGSSLNEFRKMFLKSIDISEGKEDELQTI